MLSVKEINKKQFEKCDDSLNIIIITKLFKGFFGRNYCPQKTFFITRMKKIAD